MAAEVLCLQWNEFQANQTSSYRSLRKTPDFSDVTLVCEDCFNFLLAFLYFLLPFLLIILFIGVRGFYIFYQSFLLLVCEDLTFFIDQLFLLMNLHTCCVLFTTTHVSVEIVLGVNTAMKEFEREQELAAFYNVPKDDRVDNIEKS